MGETMEYMKARRLALVSGLDTHRERGLEIGALDRPVVERPGANVSYLDHLDTDGLREKYRSDPNVPNVSNIVDVDYVADGRTLAEIVGGSGAFDYVLASHVIEHVPDLLGWLSQIADILRPGGTLRLAIPDRRFTFDFLRRETGLVDVLAGMALGSQRPQPWQIIDQVMNGRAVDVDQAWRGDVQLPYADLPKALHTAMNVSRDSLDNGVYHDVHCWVFTPASFASLMGSAAGLGLVDFGCVKYEHTPSGLFEFYVVAQSALSQVECEQSWMEMERRARSDELRLPSGISARSVDYLQRDLVDTRGALRAAQSETARLAEELAVSQAEAHELRAELELTTGTLNSVLASKGWRALENGRNLRRAAFRLPTLSRNKVGHISIRGRRVPRVEGAKALP